MTTEEYTGEVLEHPGDAGKYYVVLPAWVRMDLIIAKHKLEGIVYCAGRHYLYFELPDDVDDIDEAIDALEADFVAALEKGEDGQSAAGADEEEEKSWEDPDNWFAFAVDVTEKAKEKAGHIIEKKVNELVKVQLDVRHSTQYTARVKGVGAGESGDQWVYGFDYARWLLDPTVCAELLDEARDWLANGTSWNDEQKSGSLMLYIAQQERRRGVSTAPTLAAPWMPWVLGDIDIDDGLSDNRYTQFADGVIRWSRLWAKKYEKWLDHTETYYDNIWHPGSGSADLQDTRRRGWSKAYINLDDNALVDYDLLEQAFSWEVWQDDDYTYET